MLQSESHEIAETAFECRAALGEGHLHEIVYVSPVQMNPACDPRKRPTLPTS